MTDLQFDLANEQNKVDKLRQEVAAMNEERKFWEQFKAQVAATMLPIIYRELPNSGNLVSNRQQQAVDEAAEIAERLERRLKK